jgi:hypothetical protein
MVQNEDDGRALYRFFDPNWKTQLGQQMLDLNQTSLWYRYEDPKRRLKFIYKPVPRTSIQTFKALQCWLYQCDEGNILETATLFKFFDTYIIPKWAEYIVVRTAEYDAAEWG